MDIVSIINDKKTAVKMYNEIEKEKNINKDISVKKTNIIMKNIPKTIVTTIWDSDKIKKLKILDENNNVFDEIDDLCLIKVENKVRSINKDMAFIEFPDYKISDMKINKNLFYIRYDLDKNIICNQFITNRYITFNFVYVDNDIYVCFLSKKDNASKYKKIANSNNNLLTLTINQIEMLDKEYFKNQISKESFEFIQYYGYINFNFISNVKLYSDIFSQALKVFNKTTDLNYIKILDEFTKTIYNNITKE